MKVVIVGAGQVGFHIAERLAIEAKDVVVIDRDPEALDRISEHIDVQVLQGTGISPVVLEDAGVKNAEIFLAVTDSDEANLVACLVADLIAPTTRKLARLRHKGFDQFHDLFCRHAPHIETVINPDTEIVKTIERLMSVPGAADVNEFANGRIKLVSIHLPPDSPLSGIKLIDLAQHTGNHVPLIAAIVRDDQLIVPGGNDRLMGNDFVYFTSEKADLDANMNFFGKLEPPIKRAIIVGGGDIGTRLALQLEKSTIQTKIIEKNSERCAKLADILDKVMVLNGNGSDQELLIEENIQTVDVVITLTSDEETNILTSLLAKKLGARETITRIDKFGYLSLMPNIGIERVVSPRLSAINTILQHIRKGKILSTAAIKGEQGEVLEAEALETADIVSKPLNKVPFPKNTLVISIIRDGKFIIPSGDNIVKPGDRIIIFAHRKAIPAIEKILAVKLEYF